MFMLMLKIFTVPPRVVTNGIEVEELTQFKREVYILFQRRPTMP